MPTDILIENHRTRTSESGCKRAVGPNRATHDPRPASRSQSRPAPKTADTVSPPATPPPTTDPTPAALDLAGIRLFEPVRNSPRPRAPLQVLILHDDWSAYQSAVRTIVGVVDPESDDVRLVPWKFSALETVTGRVSAALGLAKSHLIIVSCGGANHLPSAVENWLLSVFRGLTGSPGMLVALQGAPGRYARPGSPQLQFLRQMAERAGWNFLAPADERAMATTSP